MPQGAVNAIQHHTDTASARENEVPFKVSDFLSIVDSLGSLSNHALSFKVNAFCSFASSFAAYLLSVRLNASAIWACNVLANRSARSGLLVCINERNSARNVFWRLVIKEIRMHILLERGVTGYSFADGSVVGAPDSGEMVCICRVICASLSCL
jgi:hypothetical protein